MQQNQNCPESPDGASEERRSFQRNACTTNISVSRGEGDEPIRAVGANISASGIKFLSNIPYEHGSVLDIVMEPGNPPRLSHVFPPLEGRVVVRRVDGSGPPYQVAAEFLWLQ